MVDTLNSCFLAQCVNFPTFHLNDRDPGSLLDLIITNAPDRIFCLESKPPLGDIERTHSVIYWEYVIKEPCRFERVERPNVRKADFQRISEEISEVDWEMLFQDKDVNACYIEFLKYYRQICSKNVPKKRPKICAIKKLIRPSFTHTRK